MGTFTAYIKVEMNDGQIEKLLEKAGQPVEALEEDIQPQVVIYEKKREADWIPVQPQILRVIASKDRNGQPVLEGKVYPEGKSFEIVFEP